MTRHFQHVLLCPAQTTFRVPVLTFHLVAAAVCPVPTQWAPVSVWLCAVYTLASPLTFSFQLVSFLSDERRRYEL